MPENTEHIKQQEKCRNRLNIRKQKVTAEPQLHSDRGQYMNHLYFRSTK